jgi:inosine-uridine nucleoside N-ribohydrolase
MIDPEGSKIALTADFPDIIIAGNVANQVMSTQEFLDEVYEVKNPYSELMHKYYAAEAFFPFWDETAMALLVDPSINTNSSTGISIALCVISYLGYLLIFGSIHRCRYRLRIS